MKKCKSQKIPETERNTNHSEKTTTGVLQNLKGVCIIKKTYTKEKCEDKMWYLPTQRREKGNRRKSKRKTNKPKSKKE
jgi:hypothetical protein